MGGEALVKLALLPIRRASRDLFRIVSSVRSFSTLAFMSCIDLHLCGCSPGDVSRSPI